jgi:hypothetical protein
MMADQFTHPGVKIDPLSSENAEIPGPGRRRRGLGPRPARCLLPSELTIKIVRLS